MNRTKTIKPLAHTAMAMGRALFVSDVGHRIAPYTVEKCADVCSWVGRSFLGRSLLVSDNEPVFLDLENGKWLRVTMVDAGDTGDNRPSPSHVKQVADMAGEREKLVSMLRALVTLDAQTAALKGNVYVPRSPAAKLWASARKLLKDYE